MAPQDIAANIITETIHSRHEDRSQSLMIYHICNPQPTGWDTLVPEVAKACDAEIVSLRKWILSLEDQKSNIESTSVDFSNFPALYLLPFFQTLADGQNRSTPTLDVSNVRKHSATLSTLRPVDESVMKVWLQQLKGWITNQAL